MSAIVGRTALDLAGASSALVAALEAAWSAIVARHPEIPRRRAHRRPRQRPPS